MYLSFRETISVFCPAPLVRMILAGLSPFWILSLLMGCSFKMPYAFFVNSHRASAVFCAFSLPSKALGPDTFFPSSVVPGSVQLIASLNPSPLRTTAIRCSVSSFASTRVPSDSTMPFTACARNSVPWLIRPALRSTTAISSVTVAKFPLNATSPSISSSPPLLASKGPLPLYTLLLS